MSERGSERDWQLCIDDMIEFAQRSLAYTEGMDQQRFVGDRMRYDATLRNLELIGEAAGRVPPGVRLQAPHVPWRQMIALRNRLAHAYLGVDDDVIWSVLQDDLVGLIRSLEVLRTP